MFIDVANVAIQLAEMDVQFERWRADAVVGIMREPVEVLARVAPNNGGINVRDPRKRTDHSDSVGCLRAVGDIEARFSARQAGSVSTP